MKKFFIACIITIIIGLIPILLYDHFVQDDYKWLGLAMVIAVVVFVLLVASSLLFAYKFRQYGQAVLLSAGIILLIGFSVCTLS